MNNQGKFIIKLIIVLCIFLKIAYYSLEYYTANYTGLDSIKAYQLSNDLTISDVFDYVNFACSIILLVILIISVVYFWLRFNANKDKETELARLEYIKALRLSDKSIALDRGRYYYRLLRGGNLTIYDEQAIANDLSAMKDKEQK